MKERLPLSPERPRPDSGTIRPALTPWLEENLHRLDALVIDIDGIIILGRRPIAAGGILLQRLRQKHFPFILLTNDGSYAPVEKSQMLGALGITVYPEEIISCAEGLRELVQSRPALAGQPVFVIGRLGQPCFADAAGLQATRDLSRLADCAAVIVGEKGYGGEERFQWEPVFTKVINFLLKHPERPLIVPNPDEYYAMPGGEIRVAAGGHARFIRQVLAAAGIPLEPCYLGKPYRPIFEHGQAVLEKKIGRPVDHRRMLMVGDSLDSDIRGAGRFGYQSALVLSGVTRRNMLATAEPRPDWIFETI